MLRVAGRARLLLWLLMMTAGVERGTATGRPFKDNDYTPDPRVPVSLGELTVSEGGSAALPCDMSLPSADDAIYLVVWFLEPSRKPIYTFDARGKPLSMGRRWSEVASFGLRADFRFNLHGQMPSKGHLVINGTSLADEGLYRCRIDFKNSPARHHRVQLNVTVPPSMPEIADEMGREIRSAKIGPLMEKQTILLQCRVIGGKPPPQVVWLLNGIRLASERREWAPILTGVPRSAERGALHIEEVRLGPLKRFHQDASITCQATNSPLNPPRVKTLSLDIQLPPLKADILSKERRFVTGDSSEIKCETYGSRPTASISWWKDNIRLPDTSYKVFDDEAGNVTISLFKTVFNKDDHGKTLTCRASNRHLEASAVEDFLRLDVQFPPLASLHLGPELNPNSIKEGDDVYFECSITANPDVTRLIWKHEGRTLTYNVSAGVIMSNQSLVLRGVTRNRSGDYKCSGINTRGEGSSGPVALSIRYVPVCRHPIRNIRGTERGESAALPCSVDAFPRPLSYRWALNTTRGWKDIPSSGSSEILNFKPDLEADYGTVACWASNDVGRQKEPCLFRFFPAGPPESLSNCSVLNQTADSIHVSCHSNDDGGLKQTFQLQAMDGTTGLPLLTLQSQSEAEFWLEHLEPGSTFMLYLYAVNIKGLSSPVILPASTLKEAAKRTVPPTTDAFPSSIISAVAMGSGAGLLLVASISVIVCIRCKRRGNGSGNENHSTARSEGMELEPIQKGPPPANFNGCSTASSINTDELAENAGFCNSRHLRPVITASPSSIEHRKCQLKLPPDFVPLSDIPESCV